MTPDQLVQIGHALYGEPWQTPLARAIGCDTRTVRRWVSGRLQIGEATEQAIRRLAAMRNVTLPGERLLHHVILSTGHLQVTPRTDVHDDIVTELQGLAAKGGGISAGVSWRVDREGAHAALVTIGNPAAVLMTVCLDEAGSENAWLAALALHRESGHKSAPADRPPVPWLAVTLLPAMFAMSLEDVHMLGDMERRIAWALIES